MISQYKSGILARKEIAENTIEISLVKPKGFEFEAGQYVQILIPKLLYEDPRGVSRLFSIASSPNDKRRLAIAFRLSGSGYKRTLMEARLDHEIVIRGPFGKDFSFSRVPWRKLVFVAGGIGITPFLSMLNFYSEEKLTLPLTLLYANRARESAAYLKELDILADRNPNFRIENRFGLFDQAFLKQNVTEPKETGFYIAGPPAMVEKVENLLFDLGVGKDNIKKERFMGY